MVRGDGEEWRGDTWVGAEMVMWMAVVVEVMFVGLWCSYLRGVLFPVALLCILLRFTALCLRQLVQHI